MTYEPVAKSSAPKLANTPAPLTLSLRPRGDGRPRDHYRGTASVLARIAPRL